MLRRYLIEREIANVGMKSSSELGEAARTSNGALSRLSGIQWQYSFVSKDRTFCVYLADSEAAIHEHARLSGFPANRITEIPLIIDPTTERQCEILAKTA